MATTYNHVEDVPELYRCGICNELMQKPVLIDCCGYHFCEECIVKRRKCPQCDVKPKRRTVNRQMMACIEALKVRCTHSDKGCQWTGQRKDLKDHLKEGVLTVEHACEYQELECHCENYFQRAKILEHMEKECGLRLTSCEHCGMEKRFLELYSHYSKCFKYPINCPYDCGNTELQRRYKKEHMETCGKQEVECKYGCEGKLKRKDVKKHYRDNKDLHLSLLLEENAALKKDKVKLKKEIAKLKKDNAQCARKRRRYPTIDSDSDSDKEDFVVSVKRDRKHI